MTRMSKQGKRRAICPRKRTPAFAEKTGPKKDQLDAGYKVHENACSIQKRFIAKVK